MRVTETNLPDGAYEQRFKMMIGSRVLDYFVRRPASIEPPEGTICFVDDGPRYGRVYRRSAGSYKGGQWVGVKFEPTHWTIWEALSSDEPAPQDARSLVDGG